MTMPELLTQLCIAQEAARKAGATDDEVAELRRSMIQANSKESTGQDYANQWQPVVITDEEPEPPPINPGRTKQRRYDRF